MLGETGPPNKLVHGKPRVVESFVDVGLLYLKRNKHGYKPFSSNATHFITLLCLMPDDFTRQGESADTQWVKVEVNVSNFSYSFRSIANQTGVRYSNSTSYFKKYSSSKCKQTVCLHYGVDLHFNDTCFLGIFSHDFLA